MNNRILDTIKSLAEDHEPKFIKISHPNDTTWRVMIDDKYYDLMEETTCGKLFINYGK